MVFEQTSKDPYTRHIYRLHLENGSHLDFDDYTICRNTWMNSHGQGCLSIEVMDKPKVKGKGFE